MGNAKKILSGLEIARKAAPVLFAKKAEEAILIDLAEISSITDYYLICTCQNEVQMKSIMQNVVKALSKEGVKALRSEYHPGVRWAVLDYGDLIVHLFEKQTRAYYSLERLWGDGKATTWKPEDFPTVTEALDDDDEEL
jgi:ribosome-associated protein